MYRRCTWSLAHHRVPRSEWPHRQCPHLAQDLAYRRQPTGPSKFVASTLTTIPNVNTEGFWESALNAVIVDGKDAGLQGRTAILDTVPPVNDATWRSSSSTPTTRPGTARAVSAVAASAPATPIASGSSQGPNRTLPAAATGLIANVAKILLRLFTPVMKSRGYRGVQCFGTQQIRTRRSRVRRPSAWIEPAVVGAFVSVTG
ncbi:hypothetical protein B0H11DRAFT_1009948 [Mycena galericulata]|nr:hypothetical protein B0H11DRAFT_1009948 [Mycena galericulata]